ncbi:MAG: hypothetical protein EAX90_01455 [Candidatus Heimdallarchaeota archaeon]|nr:hypothetical protein [Candidatus Heimdallarchaeota archaeon]
MLIKRNIFLGIIFSALISLNSISFVFGFDPGESIYLNKVAECTFEVGYRIITEDNIVYVTDNDGILIIDVENPYSPKKISRIESSEATFGLKVINNILYAVGGSGLIIANVSNPSQPETLAEYTTAMGSFSVGVKDNICYLGYRENRVEIYNVSNLTNPVFITQMSAFGLDDIVIHNDLLFGADPNYGLRILNISDPINPVLVKNLNIAGATDISINSNLLFLGCHLYGVKVIDISNPSTASVLSSSLEDDDGEAQGVIYTEGFLCVADNYGVELFNITNPSRISKIDEFRRGISAAHDIAAISNFVFVAKGFGLGIFEISNVKSFYFPPFLYYVIPISSVVVIGIGLFVYLKKVKRKKIHST